MHFVCLSALHVYTVNHACGKFWNNEKDATDVYMDGAYAQRGPAFYIQTASLWSCRRSPVILFFYIFQLALKVNIIVRKM